MDYSESEHLKPLDLFEDRARADSGYAIAYAVIQAATMLSKAINGLNESLRSDHPLQGETLSGVEHALVEIADALLGLKQEKD